jgi:hypothetical protein
MLTPVPAATPAPPTSYLASLFSDPVTFAKKHLGAKPPWMRDAHVEDARREIVERFLIEEWAHRVIDTAEAAPGHRLIVHKPLSECRPMRAPAAAAV